MDGYCEAGESRAFRPRSGRVTFLCSVQRKVHQKKDTPALRLPDILSSRSARGVGPFRRHIRVPTKRWPTSCRPPFGLIRHHAPQRRGPLRAAGIVPAKPEQTPQRSLPTMLPLRIQLGVCHCRFEILSVVVEDVGLLRHEAAIVHIFRIQGHSEAGYSLEQNFDRRLGDVGLSFSGRCRTPFDGSGARVSRGTIASTSSKRLGAVGNIARRSQ